MQVCAETPARLQNGCGRAAHGSVGSTPAPLRQATFGASRPMTTSSSRSRRDRRSSA